MHREGAQVERAGTPSPLRLEQIAPLDRVPGLAHGLTTRAGGRSRGPFRSLNLGLATGDDRATVLSNRRRAATALGFDQLALLRQVHGRRVVYLDHAPDTPEAADGIVTDRPGLLVGVLGADCPGVLLAHPKRRALAVVHAGWRGVVAGVVDAALDVLERRCGASLHELRAAIGPGVSAPRYEVSAEVAAAVSDALRGVPSEDVALAVRPGRTGHAHVDLVAAIRAQLVRAGVPPEHVTAQGGCTYDDPARWYSHRRDGGRTGRHALLAGWTG